MDPELKLIEEARGGSKDAFAELVFLHQAQLRAYLGRYSRNMEVVDDLAQETFLGAYRSLGTYRGGSSFRIWLLGIAHHRGLKHLRDADRRRSHEGRPLEAVLPGWMARQEPDLANFARHERELLALKSCIQKLPGENASILTDYYFKGQSAADIAKKSGRKQGTVWVILMRIRQALRDCVQLRLAATGEES